MKLASLLAGRCHARDLVAMVTADIHTHSYILKLRVNPITVPIHVKLNPALA